MHQPNVPMLSEGKPSRSRSRSGWAGSSHSQSLVRSTTRRCDLGGCSGVIFLPAQLARARSGDVFFSFFNVRPRVGPMLPVGIPSC